MKQTNIYSISDKVAGSSLYVVDATNDGMVIRTQAPQLGKNIPLGDVEIFQIAYFNPETLSITPCEPRLVSWESYKFPENPFTKTETSDTVNSKEVKKSEN